MAIREIRTVGDDILRKKCKPVERFDERLHMLLDDMKDTLKHAEGLGLAAPQVGVLRRAVLVCIGDQIYELINPVIVEQSGTQQNIEGCLSIPGKHGEVMRPKKIKVQAYNRDGDLMEYEAEDFNAVIFCHEIDHLDGILYADKAIGGIA